MRLLGRDEIVALLEDPSGPLEIQGFDESHLQHCYYFIRLGDTYFRHSDGLVDDVRHLGGQFLDLNPGEYVRVHTYERFRLEGSIIGELTSATDVHRQGLQLVNSDKLDPFYPMDGGDAMPLEFGLRNLNPSKASLLKATAIAKVYFYDISDSGPLDLDRESKAARAHKSRRIPTATTTLRGTGVRGEDQSSE
jgi:hypothetical protein